MRPRSLPLVTVAVTVLALGLGACTASGTPSGSSSGPSSPPASATPSPPATTPTPTASAMPPPPAPTPSPTADKAEPFDPKPPFEELVVSTAGVGPLTIDAAPETNPGAAMISWEADACGMWDPENPGRWVTTYPPIDGQHMMGIGVYDGVVGWIDILQPGPRTAEGVGMGTDLATLQAAYPDLVEGTPGPVSRVWWIGDEKGYVNFETRGDRTPPEQVVAMRVLSPDANPDFAAANTDFVAGGCF